MKKVDKSSFAGTEAEQRIADDNSTSASLLPNTVLSAALSVEEGNKLIGEFMNHPFIKKWKRYNYKGEFPYKDLKYHSSWDWLMPVVEKIEKLGYGMDINPHGINVIDYTTGNEEGRIVFINDDNYPKIYQIYWTVVEFIKWHNDNPVSVGSR